jgi:hypothetical protein
MNFSKSPNWKMERASVTLKRRRRPRSNKYSHSDSHGAPQARSRQRVWVAGYKRSDGTKVTGHYRSGTRV